MGSSATRPPDLSRCPSQQQLPPPQNLAEDDGDARLFIFPRPGPREPRQTRRAGTLGGRGWVSHLGLPAGEQQAPRGRLDPGEPGISELGTQTGRRIGVQPGAGVLITSTCGSGEGWWGWGQGAGHPAPPDGERLAKNTGHSVQKPCPERSEWPRPSPLSGLSFLNYRVQGRGARAATAGRSPRVGAGNTHFPLVAVPMAPDRGCRAREKHFRPRHAVETTRTRPSGSPPGHAGPPEKLLQHAPSSTPKTSSYPPSRGTRALQAGEEERGSRGRG